MSRFSFDEFNNSMQDKSSTRKRDRVILTFCVISILVISVIFILNAPINTETEFTLGGYYVPEDVTARKSSAQNEPFSSYVSMRNVECPGFGTNNVPTGSTFVTNGVYAGRQTSAKTPVKFTHFIFTKQELYGDEATDNVIKRGNIKQVLCLNNIDEQIVNLTIDKLVTCNPHYKGDLREGDEVMNEMCYEIIAPFAYTIENCNLDEERKKIVILNSDKTCRITIENVSNWFCAGVPGTDMITDSRLSEGVTAWSQHYGKHLTWVGNHNNSKKTSGTAGELIGYGNAATTFKIEYHSNGTWQPATWRGIYGIT